MVRKLSDLSDGMSPPERISLRRTICAIKLSLAENKNELVGALTKLVAGTSMYLCGPGLNDHTARVMVDGHYYLVFRHDIG